MIRRFLLVGAIVVGLIVAAFVGVSAYQALHSPLPASSNSDLAPENCSPGPCVDMQGLTLWISDIKVEGDLVSMQVKFHNSIGTRHASPGDLQLIDASRHQSVPLTNSPGCETWMGHDLGKGASFGPVSICYRVFTVTRPFILHWTPDLGPFCCETNIRIN
jgi:hypothetical protein